MMACQVLERDQAKLSMKVRFMTIMVGQGQDFSRETVMAVDQPGADRTSVLGDDSNDGEKLMDSREI